MENFEIPVELIQYTITLSFCVESITLVFLYLKTFQIQYLNQMCMGDKFKLKDKPLALL